MARGKHNRKKKRGSDDPHPEGEPGDPLEGEEAIRPLRVEGRGTMFSQERLKY